MTGEAIEYHIKAVIALKSLEDASSSEISITTRQESDADEILYPILKKIGSIGTGLGDFMPIASSTSIVLYNHHGSIGYEKKFSDLLERNTIINQKISIYICACAVGEFDSADYELHFVGTVKRIKNRGDELTIEVAGRGIEDRVITTRVTRELFEYAPDTSLGYALPVIIGESVSVKPVIVSDVNPESIEYAYGTNLVDYRCGGVQKIYAQDYQGRDAEVQSAATVSTLLYGVSVVGGKANAAWSANTEYAHRFPIGSAGHIITSASVWVYKAAGVAAGDMDIALQVDDLLQNGSSANWGRAPGTILGSGNFELAKLNSAAGPYEIRVNFDRPVVLKPYQNWFFTYRLNNETTSRVGVYYDAAVTESQFYKTTNDTLWLENASANRRYWGLYGVKIYDTPPTSISRWAGITIDQNGDLDEVPDITRVAIKLEVNGLEDSSSGTVTGTNNLLIESPQHVVELLTKQFNGTTYTGGQFGSEHSDTWPEVNSSGARFFRKIKGKTFGVTTLSAFIEAICRQSACRIAMHPHASTPIGFYAWGSNHVAVDRITQEDCEIESFEILGTETVINNVELFYSETLIDSDLVTGNSLGEYRNYTGRFSSKQSSDPAYAECQECSSVSYSVFGSRELQNKTYSFIGDSKSAVSVALSLLRRNAFPTAVCEIEVPFVKFKGRKLLDVITLSHPNIPSNFGSTPSAQKPTYDQDAVDLAGGFYFPRANTYRAQIEGRYIIFDSQNNPRLRFILHLLNNPKDPT